MFKRCQQLGSGATAVALSLPDVTALFGALGSWFAILGIVVLASLYWDRTTDLATFVSLLIGVLAPPVSELAMGNFQAATVVGLVSAAVVVGTVSVLGERQSKWEGDPVVR